jgi:carboxymethylenebutenolidase
MEQHIIDLYDEYTHKPLSRKEFISRLAKITGSMAAALSVIPLLEGQAAPKAPIEDIKEERFEFKGTHGTVKTLLARPKAAGKYPAVMIVHENRGLNPHIEEVTRRMAREGFLAMAPDALSPRGGTPADADEARTWIGQLDAEQNLRLFLDAFQQLTTHPNSTGKVGCMGFCWGGAMANAMAVHEPRLLAAAPFYGRQAAIQDVPHIKAALMLHYAEKDERVNAGIPAYEEALKEAGVNYQLFMYEGAQHAFLNDSSPARYHEEAATLAWQRTVNFLKIHLGG